MIGLIVAASLFVHDFGGTWTCGNASYHEPWVIRDRPGGAPSAQMAEVVYGDPVVPDGFAYVYFVPDQNEWRYDDFHADGGQSHLRSPGPRNGAWTWTGTYDPPNAAPDPNPVITWQRSGKAIVRRFEKRTGSGTDLMGSDRCTAQHP